MEAQCYFIRHLKTGVLTDRVYLEKPTQETLVKLFGEADVNNNLVRVVPAVVVSNNKDNANLFSKLDKINDVPVVTSPPKSTVYKVVASGTGTVTNPKK